MSDVSEIVRNVLNYKYVQAKRLIHLMKPRSGP